MRKAWIVVIAAGSAGLAFVMVLVVGVYLVAGNKVQYVVLCAEANGAARMEEDGLFHCFRFKMVQCEIAIRR